MLDTKIWLINRLDYFIFILIAIVIFCLIKKLLERRKKMESQNISKYFINRGYIDYELINLRNKYIKLYLRKGKNRMEAAASLDERIDTLRKNNPNKKMKWYIKKAINEMKKDRNGKIYNLNR